MLDLTYTSGIVIKRGDIPLASDGLRIGACTSNDNSLLSCTGGCNDLSVGGDHCSDCQAGAMAGLKIDCFNGKKIW